LEANLAPFRKRLTNHIMDEREVTMTKMGAIMAQGIIDAGGRNVTIGRGLHSSTSQLNLSCF
jgi:26S proteasome regulatory subunit N2